MTEIPFAKMQALNNDFIVVSERVTDPEGAKDIAERYCGRRFGIGADSVLYLHQSEEADIGMRIFERDRSESNMCGNGIRCVASAHIGQGEEIDIETRSGIKTVEGYAGEYRVDMGEVSVTDLGSYYDVDVGEPHRVKFVDGLGLFPHIFEQEVKKVRRGENINVNFVCPDGEMNTRLHIRTFERGVEGETQSCGTGIVAAAAAFRFKEDYTLIYGDTKGGMATVRFEDDRALLQGPAQEVFYGKVEI